MLRLLGEGTREVRRIYNQRTLRISYNVSWHPFVSKTILETKLAGQH